MVFFLVERFLFVFRGEFSSGNLLSASALTMERRLHHDLFGSGRGTSTLNLQIEFLVALSGGVEGAPFQRVNPAWARKFLFLVKKGPPCRECFS